MGKWKVRLAPLIGLASFPAGKAIQYSGSGIAPQVLANNLVTGYTGYDQMAQKWDTSQLVATYGPIIAGFVISFLASKFGANKFLPPGVNL